MFPGNILEYTQDSALSQSCVIFSGFPYDEGTVRMGDKSGGSEASSCFRKTLFKSQLSFCQKINVYDAGDIQKGLQLQKAHEILKDKNSQILKREENLLLVVVGGSRDQSYLNASSLLCTSSGKVGVINIDSHLDMRPVIEGKATSGNPFRRLLNDQLFIQKQCKFVEFGVKGAVNAKAHYDFLIEKQCQVFWLETVIRRHKLEKDSKWKSQGGQVFAKVLQKMDKECQKIFVTVDLDSINCKWMPGVVVPSVLGGLTAEEILQIMEIAGLCEKVRLVDFSEFNPLIEAEKSSTLLVEMFHNLCKGFSLRKKK